ncbi:hypothetical protein wTpre_1295 [Wolbachia endosymbiont of Trichogramma pretiosum]|nr:hypothetical protein wTpre_1295 [Wolbachia endosymbiont of Trichogramma pretiosum]
MNKELEHPIININIKAKYAYFFVSVKVEIITKKEEKKRLN